MDNKENNIIDLRNFFGTEERPVQNAEMTKFWKSLTDEEKEYYRKANLTG